MAFASVGSFGTASSTTAGTTLALTPTVTLEVGNLAVLIVGIDNALAQTLSNDVGHFHEIVTSITDTGSNTWREFGSNVDDRAVAAGSGVTIWVCKITTQLTTASTVTITHTTATTRAATGWEFTFSAGDLACEDLQRGYLQVLDPPSMTLDDLPSREYLFIRGIGLEADDNTFTPTTNYTAFTNAVADPGTDANSMAAYGEFRILTGTTDSSNPTASAHDNASVYLVLSENVATIPVVSGGNIAVGSTTGHTPTLPYHETNDILLLVVEASGLDTVSLTTANGFARIAGGQISTSETTLDVYWRRGTGSAPVLADAGNHVQSKIFVLRGCHDTGNPWDFFTTSSKETPSTAVSVTGGTTTVNECLVLSIATNGTDLSTREFSAWANASLTRFRELDSTQTAGADGGGFSVAVGRKATAGTVNASTATLVTSSDNANMMIAFKPQQAAGGATEDPYPYIISVGYYPFQG